MSQFSNEELCRFIESAGGPASLARAIGYPILALKASVERQTVSSDALGHRIWWLNFLLLIVGVLALAEGIMPVLEMLHLIRR